MGCHWPNAHCSNVLIAQMSYASQAWWGFIDDTSRNRYESIIKRLEKTEIPVESA